MESLTLETFANSLGGVSYSDTTVTISNRHEEVTIKNVARWKRHPVHSGLKLVYYLAKMSLA